MAEGIQGFATNAERGKRLVEARQWAAEPVPWGHERSVGYVFVGKGETPVAVRIERIDVAQSFAAFMYDQHPELWPGAATFPVHDEPRAGVARG